MYNLFTADNLDGVMTAAHYHALARHTKSGIHVYFCRDDLNRKVKALSDSVTLARTLDHKLPDVRFIVLAGINAPPEVDAILNRLEQEDNTVHVFREPHMETTAVRRALLHLYVQVYSLFHAREEAMHKLSDFLYNRRYSQFSGAGRD